MYGFEFTQNLASAAIKGKSRLDLGITSCYVIKTFMTKYEGEYRFGNSGKNLHVITPSIACNKDDITKLADSYATIFTQKNLIDDNNLQLEFYKVDLKNGDLSHYLAVTRDIKASTQQEDLKSTLENFISAAHGYEVELSSVLKSANQPT